MEKVIDIPMYMCQARIYYIDSNELDTVFEKLKLETKINEDLLPKIKNHLIEKELKKTMGICSKAIPGGGVTIYIIFLWKEKIDDPEEVLIHELNHLTDNILDRTGIHDTEARSYLYTWLWKEGWKKGIGMRK